MGIPSIRIRPDNPDFLDLPWDESVTEWTHERLVSMPKGVHRHPVVFVAYEQGIYAIKEMPVRLANREYEVLLELESRTHRSASPAGLVERNWLDAHVEASAAVITRFVRHAFPYRRLISGPGFGGRRNQMLNAVASLLVELHIVGCYWGDCSLSNVLYRFDAGEIEAIMIDAETSELHLQLSDGQRLQDIGIMVENIAGEMSDIAAMGGDSTEADLTLGESIAGRYSSLWDELTEDLVLTPDESYRIRERIARINQLGFSIHDIDLRPGEPGRIVRMKTRVGGRTFNSDRLRGLTGIDASENQARVLFGDLNYHLAKHHRSSSTERNVGTFQWLTESFEPIVASINDLWHGDDPIQGYCDFLNHRMELASARGSDVPNSEALESWVSAGFPGYSPD